MATKRIKNKSNQNLNNKLIDKIKNLFLDNFNSAYNYKQIAKRIDFDKENNRSLIKDILSVLVKQKYIEEIRTGKYQLHPSQIQKLKEENIEKEKISSYIIGRVDMKRTGKAYIIREDKGEDILIAANNTNRAFDGDEVKVLLFPRRRHKKPEGQIIDIIKRSKTQFVGILMVSKNYAFLSPDNTSIPVDFYIPLEQLNGAKNGDKAVAEMTEWPEKAKNPFGKIIYVLGKPGDNNVEMQSILAEFDFPLKFPDKVELAAKQINKKINSNEIKLRKDCRNLTTFTIDPADAKDFDDALSLKILDKGKYEVGVHIADVSYYVQKESELDKEAYKRATSVYLVDRVIPMLPEKLSNDVCSLKPDEDRLCFSAIFIMNDKAEISEQWFGKTVIHSKRRFNYDEVQEIIETKKGDYNKEINILNKLAVKLRQQRYSKGSINFFTEEVKFKLDDKGRPLDVYIKEQKDSHKLVEDFMLLANRKVAELFGIKKTNEQSKPFVYRIHDKPSEEKLQDFKNFVKNLGYNINIESPKAIADSFNKLFEEVIDKPEENIITQLAIRTMAKAIYSTDNIGHYGLAFDYYTHFTSPIRRYPDLLVHRLLTDKLTKTNKNTSKSELEKQCIHSSEMERKAVDAERASVKYKQVEFMKDKVGQIFEGVISGISKWGLYVIINESKCEGMVSLKDMNDDVYYLDDKNFKVIGYNRKKQYRLGDDVKIKVVLADLAKKHLNFIFWDDTTK